MSLRDILLPTGSVIDRLFANNKQTISTTTANSTPSGGYDSLDITPPPRPQEARIEVVHSSKSEEQTEPMDNKMEDDNESIMVPDRGVSIKKQEINDLLKPTIYSEASGSERPDDKIKLEVDTILNTMFNRMKSRKQTLTQIITEADQYQGYGSKKFQEYQQPANELDAKHRDKISAMVDQAIEDIQNNSFKNNIGEAQFYAHLKNGKIRAFDTWEEYKKAIDAGIIK